MSVSWRGGRALGFTAYIFLATLAIYLACSFPMLRLAAGDRPGRFHLLTGDEPHYLLITHSLVADGDFNLYNNAANRDWLHFTEKMDLFHEWGFEKYNALSGGRLQQREQPWTETLYSKHRLGLPVLLAPAYAVGLRLGDRTRFCAILFMILVAALLAASSFGAALEESGSTGVALACWSAIALAAPVLNYSNQIYPDLVAGLLTLTAYRLIRRTGALDTPRTLATALCIAYLPWLNERFILLAAVLFAVWMFRSRRLVTFAVALVPLLPSALMQMLYYDRLFAVPFPVNVHQGFSLAAGLRHGLPGLLLDRDNGLLWYAPIYLAAAAGLAGWWRERRAEVVGLSAVLLSYYVLVGAYRHWYSVWYPPLRYLAVILPLCVLPMATVFRRVTSRRLQAVLAALGMFGAWAGLYGISHPGRYYSGKHVLRYASPLLNRVSEFLPGLVEPSANDVIKALLALAAAAGFTMYLERKTRLHASNRLPAGLPRSP